ncbi:hypothetical protein QBC42DRAFT_238365 [Cladorrhinum samala]|uniref:rRNA-processing protein FYV7 n=1 Tax=Cladorrhinum samala TaxID=585594 RepID=A0AAV9H9C4_9PEZI|nr:hypothetical protein QBC42DRAFT_238365 [Cladorrhinum samala]
MAPKRARDEDATQSTDSTNQKKPRTGFRVGPDNLPDGAWKRKVTKIKKNLITKAKVKKQYAKVKAQVQAELEKRPVQQYGDSPATSDPSQPQKPAASPTIHPSRLNNLGPRSPSGPADGPNPNLLDPTHPDLQPRQPRHNSNRKHRPDYYSKELSAAQKAREAAEKRAAEIARREAEKQARIADRERFRKQMAKAKAPGKDGKRKVGREGKLLLERVQRLVGDAK